MDTSLCFVAPSFDSQAALLQQISSNASANTITVPIPRADKSNGPIRYIVNSTYKSLINVAMY